ncbi:alpha-ketoglutarate-dependent dioxygenase alkB-like protein 3 [Elysia marginata]|uniref:Alpha-ketoglutarate-dependent dioxygenase alkB homolog 3 n=1 Tax=Elysia marginata TaxID=1093978 RepID=A0AAV4HLV0_9GAST|nr:alpha-ketoglutarate-dependent dioxygenase alkB-like protein 3 [Elysia marginata]
MNFDKKRRARVQGGWAAASCSNQNRRGFKSGDPAVSNTWQNDDTNRTAVQGPSSSNSLSRVALSQAKSDKGKPPMPVGPVWMAKNIDTPSPRPAYVFQDPDEEIKIKPDDQSILKPGVFDISTEPSGVSRIRFFPNFIEPSMSEAIYSELYKDIPWRQRHDIHNGIQAMQPRLTAWFSDVPYTYAGVTEPANSSEWPPALRQLKNQLAEVTGVEFNALAANLYRDGHDSIGWHSDDEKIFGSTPIIASLSFGDERVFELRKKPAPNEFGERDYTYSQLIRIPLHSGALLIMEGCTQSDWQHRVPKEYHDRGSRINITFRVTVPEVSR